MTSYTPRPYTPELGFTDDYERVRQFLLRINQPQMASPYFPWAAWEWMFCLPYLTVESLREIVVWEKAGEIVGLTTIDDAPGELYFDIDPTCPGLKEAMLAHALVHPTGEEPLQVCISDADPDFQRIARAHGLRPTQETEQAAVLDLTGTLDYALPEGFTLISQADGFDLEKFNRCLWRGFHREGEVDASEARMEMRRRQLSGPNQIPELNIMVVAPDGHYAAYCGMWHAPGTEYTYVEPVCTDPDYRMMGCARAAIFEAGRRCAARGARTAYVVSGQQFYYTIGFNPLPAERWWVAPLR